MNDENTSSTDIAIIGIAGRFPKAANIEEFWNRLCNGEDCISFFSESDGGAAAAARTGNRVNARGILENADLFDAAFFDVKPKEAEVMDPQHRVFLECAWQALEDAGYDSTRFAGDIGVFAGMSMNTYLAHNVLKHPELIELFGEYQAMLANDKDFLPTRVSYKLNLTGPSLNVQTACSTSLVAVCVACQHLLNQQCDMALAGGVSIRFPQRKGHVHQQGGIGSADGHCRPFDASATGTVAGEGAGIVVLKRLDDAVRDRDQIYAVIKGFATNNDGADKIGYTAPSVNGQTGVIVTAQAMAGLQPEDISYVEAHGTATPLGDPIEIEALKNAFASDGNAKNYCAIGAVKSNIGHLDAAAGVAGLIKTALALHHKKIPPTAHFKSPNPRIDFADSPFFVNASLCQWQDEKGPRRAGVSSFGIGGTNAHVVLEEAPSTASEALAQQDQLLLLSAKTEAALRTAVSNLAAHLQSHPELDLADVAHTLRVGRREFAHRQAVVCSDLKEAVTVLESSNPKPALSGRIKEGNASVVFMFPGQGAQRVDMGRELYQTEAAFRAEVDGCAEILKPEIGCDLRQVLFPQDGKREEAAAQLRQTSITQPALFVVEYALARLWMSWGVQPEAMIGHSIGEYVAACLAGVFSLTDALKLVAARGRLMQQQPAGAMLAVQLTEAEAAEFLNEKLSLATVNAPKRCVISGPTEAIGELERTLKQRDVLCTVLQTSHAFHSSMMDGILEPFTRLVERTERHAPKIPFISNVSGTWIKDREAVDPAYWARHLRQTVRFSAGVEQLLAAAERIFLEVGPGHTLSRLVQQQTAGTQNTAVASLEVEAAERRSLLLALGHLWARGMFFDWQKVFGTDQPQRVHLPTYPFERRRYFIEPVAVLNGSEASSDAVGEISDDARAASESLPSNALVHVHEIEGTPRKQRIVRELKSLLSQLSGINLASLNGETFTELGFDSLFLTQVSLAIEKQLSVRVAFRELLEEFPTVDVLAARIDSLLQKEDGNDALNSGQTPSLREPSDAIVALPLTDAQQDMWFASQMSDAASCTFNECRCIRFRGKLEVGSLRSALQVLVDRHEALRITFSPEGNAQLIHSEMPLAFTLVEGPDAATELEAAQTQEAITPFNLVKGPLLRARSFRLSEDQHVLMLTIHHLVCDGSSFSILLRELATVYSLVSAGGALDLPEPAKFSDYVRRKTQRLTEGQAAKAESYWRNEFKEKPRVLNLPTDYPRANTMTFEGARAELHLPAAQVEGLRRLSAQQGCTLFTTLLAGFSVLLRQLTGQQDVLVGVPAADRGHDGDGVLVGHCISFLPVRTTVDEALPFVDYLGRVRKNFLDAHEHQHFSFGRLIQKLSVPREAGRMPLVSVTLNVERQDESFNFAGTKAELSVNPDSLTNFDLNCNIAELGSSLRVDFQYNRRLFKAERVREWFAQFRAVLESINLQPQRRLAAMFSLPEAVALIPKVTPERRTTTTSRPEWLNTPPVFEPPSTVAQQTVARIWQELLGTTSIGQHDNFFELGGHSLLMIQVLARIRSKFHTNVSIRQFFEFPTVAGLADFIEEQLTAEISDLSETEARKILRVAE